MLCIKNDFFIMDQGGFTFFFIFFCSESELKEFERRLRFKPRLKNGWFHLKLYAMFQDLSRPSIETVFWWI